MKRIIILLSISISFLNTFSQDTIFTQKGEVILSKVIEVLPTEIKYKNFNNLDGPLYTVGISDINKIVYENGSVDVFHEAGSTEEKKDNEGNKSTQLIMHGGLAYSNLREDNEHSKHRYGFAGGFTIEIPHHSNLKNFFDFTLP